MLKLKTSIAGLLDDWHSWCVHLLCPFLWINMKRSHKKTGRLTSQKWKALQKCVSLLFKYSSWVWACQLPSGKGVKVITEPALPSAPPRGNLLFAFFFFFEELESVLGKKNLVMNKMVQKRKRHTGYDHSKKNGHKHAAQAPTLAPPPRSSGAWAQHPSTTFQGHQGSRQFCTTNLFYFWSSLTFSESQNSSYEFFCPKYICLLINYHM